MFDTLNNFIDVQFEKLFNFDYKLSIKEDVTDEELNNIIYNYGDRTSKTYGIEIKNGDKKEANTLFVDDSKGYVRFVDHKYNFVELTDDGVFVTEKLAANKGYKIGDTIEWHIFGDNNYYRTKIVGFDRDAENQNVKMTKTYLKKLGIEYRPDSLYTNDDMSKVKNIEGVDVIQNKNALKDGMSKMLDTMQQMLILLIALAALLGGVIIYNLGILSFTEKQYQFATLKVLGFTNKQIEKIYVKQNSWIAIISIILGLPLGYYMTAIIFKMALSENYDFAAHITLFSYLVSAIGTYVVSWVFSRILAAKIKKIDMVSSLKGNE